MDWICVGTWISLLVVGNCIRLTACFFCTRDPDGSSFEAHINAAKLQLIPLGPVSTKLSKGESFYQITHNKQVSMNEWQNISETTWQYLIFTQSTFKNLEYRLVYPFYFYLPLLKKRFVCLCHTLNMMEKDYSFSYLHFIIEIQNFALRIMTHLCNQQHITYLNISKYNWFSHQFVYFILFYAV